jgi:hypothetical protein
MGRRPERQPSAHGLRSNRAEIGTLTLPGRIRGDGCSQHSSSCCAGAKADPPPPAAAPTSTHVVKVFFVKGEQFAARLASLGYLPRAAVTGSWNTRTPTQCSRSRPGNGSRGTGSSGLRRRRRSRTRPDPDPRARSAGGGSRSSGEKGVTLLVQNSTLIRALHSSSGKRGYETPASYFNGGIAFHAYPNVPTHPDSHGCVRLPVSEAPFAYDFMSVGTPVTVYR